jgi:glucose/arabinose dehydrogenase
MATAIREHRTTFAEGGVLPGDSTDPFLPEGTRPWFCLEGLTGLPTVFRNAHCFTGNTAYIRTMIRTLVGATLFAVALFGQAKVIDLPRGPLGDGPFVLDTAEQHKIKVTVLTKALDKPFGMAFLPGGDILVSERGGKLRIVRDGVLDTHPIGGIPGVNARANAGLYDFVLHPKYGQNR